MNKSLFQHILFSSLFTFLFSFQANAQQRPNLSDHLPSFISENGKSIYPGYKLDSVVTLAKKDIYEYDNNCRLISYCNLDSNIVSYCVDISYEDDKIIKKEYRTSTYRNYVGFGYDSKGRLRLERNIVAGSFSEHNNLYVVDYNERDLLLLELEELSWSGGTAFTYGSDLISKEYEYDELDRVISLVEKDYSDDERYFNKSDKNTEYKYQDSLLIKKIVLDSFSSSQGYNDLLVSVFDYSYSNDTLISVLSNYGIYGTYLSEYTYNDFSTIIDRFNLDGNNVRLVNRSEEYYDENKLLIEFKRFDVRGSQPVLERNELYEYNAEGVQVSYQLFVDSLLDYSQNYIFNEDGYLLEYEEIEYFGGRLIVNTIVNKYDDKNRIIETNTENMDGSFIRNTLEEFVFNENDVLIKSVLNGIESIYHYSDCLKTNVFDEILPGEIKVYPNPSLDIFKIELLDIAKVEKLVVYDLTGRIVLKKRIQTNDVGISFGESLKNGSYILTLEKNNEVIYNKYLIKY